MSDSIVETDQDLHSIGDVAEATGLAPGTIRVWERRYGRPRPVRLPSGHRRYSGGHVRWLRRMAEALAGGHRPAKLMALSEEELDRLLTPSTAAASEENAILDLLSLAREFDEAAIRARLQRFAARKGPLALLHGRVAPLLTVVGRSWADGELDIRHERLVSGLLEDLLRSLRRELGPSKGPLLLFATLTGEAHGLGLQMAALTASLCGAEPRILGTDIPTAEIVAAADQLDAAAVCVSVSLATGGVRTDRALVELRERLPARRRLIVGGRGARGARRGPRGVEYAEDLAEFETRLLELVRDIADRDPRAT